MAIRESVNSGKRQFGSIRVNGKNAGLSCWFHRSKVRLAAPHKAKSALKKWGFLKNRKIKSKPLTTERHTGRHIHLQNYKVAFSDERLTYLKKIF